MLCILLRVHGNCLQVLDASGVVVYLGLQVRDGLGRLLVAFLKQSFDTCQLHLGGILGQM